MYSAKIFLALETILDWDLIFLNSSQASQNSRFSSLNSVRRKALKAASPSVGTGTRLYSRSPTGNTPQDPQQLCKAAAQTTSLYCPNPPCANGQRWHCQASTAAQPSQELQPRRARREAGLEWGQHPLAIPMGWV